MSQARLLLPLLAFFWLTAIYASVLFGRVYTVDAVVQPRGNDLTVVSAGDGARRAGLLHGMVVLRNHLSPADAMRFRAGVPFGMPLRIPVATSSEFRTIAVNATKPRPTTTPLRDAVDLVTITFALVLAAFLATRRPGVMTAALIVFLGGADLSWPKFVVFFARAPDFVYLATASVVSALCNWFPVLALASFAIRLPGNEPRRKQHTAIRIVDAIVALGIIVALFPESNEVYLLCTALSGVVLLSASIAALRFAQPSDRARVGIVFAGVMIGGVGYAVNMIALRAFNEPRFLFFLYVTLSVLIVPVSLAYAIVRHRVFDIAFVLNRTIVYGVTSAVVVLVFAALEFAAERLLTDLTRVEGLALQFGIAILIIVAIRLVHGRADRLVDNVFFRSRHEQESALRRFADTLQFYTEESPLLRDTLDTLARFARVHGVALYLARTPGLDLIQSSFSTAAPKIGENDAAYVELRAHHQALQIPGMPTAFPGDRLYPMILAGRTRGVIATGERVTGEAMPPDIDDALKQIAASIAITLAAIETDRIRVENAALQARLTDPRVSLRDS